MSEDEPRTESAPDPGVGEHVPPRSRRPNVTVLLTFVGVFLLLIVVFREVLFPFLMAMFIAYLVEPLVQRATRSRIFGVRWTRGPTIVLIYVLIIGGGVFGAWKGLTTMASYVRGVATSLAEAAKQEVPRAYVRVPEAQRGLLPIDMPAGTLLGTPDAGRFRTVHDLRIEEPGREVGVLLAPETPEGGTVPTLEEHEPLDILEGAEALRAGGGKPLADPSVIEIEVGPPATGLELRLEEELISPIVENMKGLDIVVAPNTVREFLAHKAAVWKQELPLQVGTNAVRFAGHIALSIYQFFLILMLTAFIVTDRKGISQFFANLTPAEHRPEYLKLMEYVDDGLAGVIRGQLVICAMNGGLTWAGLTVLGVKGALTLSIVAAVLSLIPIFGTIVSSIPIVLIAATEGIDTGLFALLWIGVIHMLEANVFNPMIMGSHARMHPVVIVFALLAGEHSFGVWGALLAVPAMSIIQSCFRFYLHEIEGLPETDPKPHGLWIKHLWAKLTSRFGGGAADGERKTQ